MTEHDRPSPPPGNYHREGSGLEFDRVSFFSDAVYAIAMTLLVVELEVPQVAEVGRNSGALATALAADWPQVFGFFLGFVLLGRYWRAHHLFFASLRSIDARLIALNLAYLALVAFTPFPVALISEYEGNGTAFLVFGVCMAAISGMETVMYLHAVRANHTREVLSPEVFRYGLLGSAMPVGIMLLSLPLAAVSPTAGLVSWLLMIPAGRWLQRYEPADYRALRYPPTA